MTSDGETPEFGSGFEYELLLSREPGVATSHRNLDGAVALRTAVDCPVVIDDRRGPDLVSETAIALRNRSERSIPLSNVAAVRSVPSDGLHGTACKDRTVRGPRGDASLTQR